MVQITFEELPELRKRLEDKKIVFCSGSFDLTHAGHILFFEDCKKIGDILIVSIGNDKLINKIKGKSRPILNEHVRIKTIDSIKFVDYCFIEPFFDSDNNIFGLDPTFEKLRPDIYVINKDASNIPYRKELCKKYSINLVVLERHCPAEFENISTTKLIDKIQTLK